MEVNGDIASSDANANPCIASLNEMLHTAGCMKFSLKSLAEQQIKYRNVFPDKDESKNSCTFSLESDKYLGHILNDLFSQKCPKMSEQENSSSQKKSKTKMQDYISVNELEFVCKRLNEEMEKIRDHYYVALSS